LQTWTRVGVSGDPFRFFFYLPSTNLESVLDHKVDDNTMITHSANGGDNKKARAKYLIKK